MYLYVYRPHPTCPIWCGRPPSRSKVGVYAFVYMCYLPARSIQFPPVWPSTVLHHAVSPMLVDPFHHVLHICTYALAHRVFASAPSWSLPDHHARLIVCVYIWVTDHRSVMVVFVRIVVVLSHYATSPISHPSSRSTIAPPPWFLNHHALVHARAYIRARCKRARLYVANPCGSRTTRHSADTHISIYAYGPHTGSHRLAFLFATINHHVPIYAYI